jgi:hypothetical protein
VEDDMTRTLTALALAGSIAVAAVAAPTAAEARWRGGWWGPGIIGGLAAGAIIGGALAPRYYYGPGYYYGPSPYYYGYPSCWRRVWTGYGWRRAWVC